MGSHKAQFPRTVEMSLRIMPRVKELVDKDAKKAELSVNSIVAGILEKHYLGETYEEKMAKMFK